MPVLSAFSISSQGMRSQATALEMIGTNVVNVNTGGYKRSDTMFQTMVSKSTFEQSDIGGVRPVILQRISQQGALQPTSSDLDLAINGSGFFITRSTFAPSGPTDYIYTRDGSFEKAVVNQISVTDPFTGDSFRSSDAYLIDKNGNYLLGYAANTDGSFTTTGTPDVMRVDRNAFIDAGSPSTDVDLRLNLDSNAAVVNDHATAVDDFDNNGIMADGMEVLTINFVDSNGTRQNARLNFTKTQSNEWEMSATYQAAGGTQVDTVTLTGTIEAGDAYSVQVGSRTVNYTAQAGDTLDTIADALVASIAGDSVAAGIATAAATGGGIITLTAVTPGTAFTSAAGATNASGTAQQDTITIGGAVETGDIYEVIINGDTVTYTVTASDTTIDNVVSGLVSSFNNTSPANTAATAAVGSGLGELVLTARAGGTPFTATTAALDTSSTAQVDTLTFAGTVEAGDIYTVTVDGNTMLYTATGAEGSLGGLRTAITTAVNNDATLSALVTAADGGAAGEMTLTAHVPGTAMVSSTAATNVGGGIADNTATGATTTPNAVGASTNTSTVATTVANVTPVNDNVGSSLTTTANVVGKLTTAITSVPFNGDGRVGTPSTTNSAIVDPPPPIAFNLTYPAVGTAAAGVATFDLDISGFTQFGSDFMMKGYSVNGFEASSLNGISFDSIGQVMGSFDSGKIKALYKLPLATFSNPNALETLNGMTFKQTEGSGGPNIETVDSSGAASFVPNATEVSNVSLVDEFTAMIKTQQAYNSSSTAFKTNDEMLTAARDMKR